MIKVEFALTPEEYLSAISDITKMKKRIAELEAALRDLCNDVTTCDICGGGDCGSCDISSSLSKAEAVLKDVALATQPAEKRISAEKVREWRDILREGYQSPNGPSMIMAIAEVEYEMTAALNEA